MDQNERYYALEQLSEAKVAILRLTEDMPETRAAIDRAKKRKAYDLFESLKKQKSSLWEELGRCRLLLLEVGEDQAARTALRLWEAVKKFPLASADYGKFVKTMTAFARTLPDAENSVATAAVIGRLMNNVKQGFYPTDLAHVDLLVRGISFPNEAPVNLLDPCCGRGLALERLAAGENAVTYGAEIDEGRAEQAEQHLNRVATGSFFHSRISHEVFHLLFLNPPYLSVLNESGRTARHEKRFLVEGIPHLMIGGVLIYIIPHYRLTPDIARILCDNFRDLSVYRFLDPEYQKFKQLAILGVRKERGDGSAQVQGLVEQCIYLEQILSLTELPEGRYPLPNAAKEVPIFKGATFNLRELERELAQSHSLETLLEKNKLDDRERHPLLPLKISQIGLIGGSGLINGLVEGEHPHIIKGRVVKSLKKTQDVIHRDSLNRPDVIQCSETRSNKLVFNILTPDGFRSLT